MTVGRVSVFGSRWCGWNRGLGPGSGGVVLCLCGLLVRILCVDGRSRYLYIVLDRYMHILGAPSVQSCCTFSVSASYNAFVHGRYHKSSLICVWLSDIDLSRLHPPL